MSSESHSFMLREILIENKHQKTYGIVKDFNERFVLKKLLRRKIKKDFENVCPW